ncbi:winged helix-turn-helix transcriptional regulator [Coprobacter sp.]
MQNFHPTGICPIRNILSRLSNKWATLILVTLNANETMRFSDIQKSIGDISQRMLTVNLRMLETDGLISRKVYPEIPPRVEYKLTERGYSLIPHIKSLIEWAIDNTPLIMKERETS